MQIILGSAKLMHRSCEERISTSTPHFLSEMTDIADTIRLQSVEEIARNFSVSKPLAEETATHYGEIFSEAVPKVPAIYAYAGQVYRLLNASTLSPEDIAFANSHLWIVSALYGLLRPADGIRPYRLEPKTKLYESTGQTVVQFWRSRPTDILTDFLIDAVQADDGVLVDLMSQEFRTMFLWPVVEDALRVIRPAFKEEKKGKLVTVAMHAKSCRGAMARYLIQSHDSSIETLKRFSYDGFTYQESFGNENELLFVKS